MWQLRSNYNFMHILQSRLCSIIYYAATVIILRYFSISEFLVYVFVCVITINGIISDDDDDDDICQLEVCYSILRTVLKCSTNRHQMSTSQSTSDGLTVTHAFYQLSIVTGCLRVQATIVSVTATQNVPDPMVSQMWYMLLNTLSYWAIINEFACKEIDISKIYLSIKNKSKIIQLCVLRKLVIQYIKFVCANSNRSGKLTGKLCISNTVEDWITSTTVSCHARHSTKSK